MKSAARKAVSDVEPLTTAEGLEEVHRLQGILPICSYCERIRNDADYWQQVEAYVADHAPVEFTHCVCPTCYDQLVRPELDKFRAKKA